MDLMKQPINRRSALKTLGVTIGALGVAGLSSSRLFAKEDCTISTNNDLEIPESDYYGPAQVHDGHAMRVRWPYTELDPEEVAQRAYDNYWRGECMYGVTAAIVDTLREKIGGPYHAFPSMISLYGLGGVLGWSTTCGALNGAALVSTMIAKRPMAVVDEIYSFYTYEKLPNHIPPKRKMPDVKIVRTVARSPLCHASVTNWCKASGYKAFSQERKERCALVDASVACFTVNVLNTDFKDQFVPAYPLPQSVKHCRSCHDKGGILENTRGKMECISCHKAQAGDHY
jgi:hypothetical protein